MYKSEHKNSNKYTCLAMFVFLLFVVVVLLAGCAPIEKFDYPAEPCELEVLNWPKQVWFLSSDGSDRLTEFCIDLGYRDGQQRTQLFSRPYDSQISFAVQPDNGTISIDSNGNITVLKSEEELFADNQTSIEVSITISYGQLATSITIYIVPRPSHKITLDGNGVDLASGTVLVWDDSDKTYRDLFEDQHITEPQAPSGFDFVGWYHTDGDGKPTSDQEQNLDEICYLAEDVTLMARYRSKGNLLLNADGLAEDAELSPIYYHEPLSENVLEQLSESTLVSQYEGWNFDGWYSEQSGAGVQNGTNEENLFCATSAILYAKWSGTCNLHLTKKLEYVLNGSEWEGETTETSETVGNLPVETDAIDVVYNANVQLPVPNYPNGGKFVGWRTESHGNGEEFGQNGKYTLTALDLYDCFSYHISFFDADGNRQNEKDFDAIYGQKINKDHFVAPSNDELSGKDWKFDDWTIDIDDTVRNVKQYLKYPYIETEDRSVVEKWTGTLTLVADITNWSEADNNWEKQIEIIYNDELSLPQNIDLLDSTAWKVGGWFTEAYGSGEEKENVEKYVGNGKITLHAKIVMEEVALKILDKNDIFPALNIVYGKTISATSQRNLPTEEEMTSNLPAGYEFGDGWYAADEKVNDDTTFFPKGMTDLHYKLIAREYQVYFDLNGGAYNENPTMDSITAYCGEKLPDLQYIPTKTDGSKSYTFQGFATEGGTYYYSSIGEGREWNIPSNVKLVAQWADNFYIVTLNQDEVSFDKNYGDKPGDTEVEVSYNFPFQSGKQAPYRKGYTFQGYYAEQDGIGTRYYDENMKSINDWDHQANGTIYAHWTENELSVEQIPTHHDKIPINETHRCYITVSQGSGNYDITVDSSTVSDGVKVESEYNVGKYDCIISTTAKKRNQSGIITITITDNRTGMKADGNSETAEFEPLELKYSTVGNCIAAGTLITLADGSRVPVEQLTGEELLLVWNLYTGTFDAAPILFIDSDPEEDYEVIHLYFSDGTEVKVIGEHAFWDFDLNKYVFLRSDATKYIGHWFNKQTDDNGGLAWTKVQLTSVVLEQETTTAWSPVTFGHLCYYVNGMLSMPGATEGFINIFDVDAQIMKIDEYKMAADIERYGLFTYDDFEEYIPEEIFEAFGGQYLKIAMGKGLLTWYDIFTLVERYKVFWE